MVTTQARPTVLIAEDEELVREVMQFEFEDAGYETLPATSGDDAFAMLERGLRVDLLITDIRMPGALDGWALARKARSLMPGIPVIYVSGFTGDGLQPVADSRFFKKPFSAAAIVRAATELVMK